MLQMLQQMHSLKLDQRKTRSTAESWSAYNLKATAVQIIGVSNLTGAITARLLLRTEGSSAGWSSCPYQPSDAFFKSVDLQVKLLSILYFRLFMFSSPKHDHTAVLVNNSLHKTTLLQAAVQAVHHRLRSTSG